MQLICHLNTFFSQTRIQMWCKNSANTTNLQGRHQEQKGKAKNQNRTGTGQTRQRDATKAHQEVARGMAVDAVPLRQPSSILRHLNTLKDVVHRYILRTSFAT